MFKINQIRVSISSAYDMLSDPVLVVYKKNLEYLNRIAREIFILPELPCPAGMLPSPLGEISGKSFDGSLTIPGCEICGKAYDVSGFELEGYKIFILRHSVSGKPENCPEIPSVIGNRLRNPAAVLFSASSLLLKQVEPLNDQKLSRYGALLNKSNYRLLRIINNITDLSSEYRAFAPENIEIVSFCRQLTFAVKPLASEMGINFVFEPRTASRIISADPQKLERMLLNLISNSLKHTPSGGKISLSVSSGSGQIFLTVSDTGRGIAPEILSKLFDTSARSDSISADPSGLGLGLVLVKRFASMHGGTIVIESKEKSGTTATISLPGKKYAGNTPAASNYDYTGGFSHVLVELSDVLGPDTYSSNVLAD